MLEKAIWKPGIGETTKASRGIAHWTHMSPQLQWLLFYKTTGPIEEV